MEENLDSLRLSKNVEIDAYESVNSPSTKNLYAFGLDKPPIIDSLQSVMSKVKNDTVLDDTNVKDINVTPIKWEDMTKDYSIASNEKQAHWEMHPIYEHKYHKDDIDFVVSELLDTVTGEPLKITTGESFIDLLNQMSDISSYCDFLLGCYKMLNRVVDSDNDKVRFGLIKSALVKDGNVFYTSDCIKQVLDNEYLKMLSCSDTYYGKVAERIIDTCVEVFTALPEYNEYQSKLSADGVDSFEFYMSNKVNYYHLFDDITASLCDILSDFLTLLSFVFKHPKMQDYIRHSENKVKCMLANLYDVQAYYAVEKDIYIEDIFINLNALGFYHNQEYFYYTRYEKIPNKAYNRFKDALCLFR